jgi:hypothetical protein
MPKRFQIKTLNNLHIYLSKKQYKFMEEQTTTDFNLLYKIIYIYIYIYGAYVEIASENANDVSTQHSNSAS